jgi:hypothetical protein
MSEYQYYDFRAIDRPLTRQEMDELRQLSTRAEIDQYSFTNEYSYGSFRGNPDEMMLEYFDAHLYVANWGTNVLMFRLPRRLIDVSACEPYFDGQMNELTVTDDYVVVKFRSELEGGEGWLEGEGMIEPLLPLREKLLAGDLRCLYLAWLSAVLSDYGYDEEAEEPPVQPGLQQLTPDLEEFAEFMRVDEDLLAAAAERSTTSPAGAVPTRDDLTAWLARQPASRKESWLMELLTQEGIGPRREILRAFHKEHAPPAAVEGKRRTVAQLLARKEELEQERAAAAAAARAAEKRRKEQRRAAYLDGLAGREEHLWKQAEEAVETKKPAGYAQAVTILRDLYDLAERKGQLDQVRRRLGELRARHSSKSSFVRKLREAKLID